MSVPSVWEGREIRRGRFLAFLLIGLFLFRKKGFTKSFLPQASFHRTMFFSSKQPLDNFLPRTIGSVTFSSGSPFFFSSFFPHKSILGRT